MKKTLLLLTVLMLTMIVNAETIRIGESVTLRVDVPANSVFKNATWSTRSSAVSLSPNKTTCRVTGISEGTATITCSYSYQTVNPIDRSWIDHNTSRTFTVFVESNKVKSVSIYPSSLELDLGKTGNLSASLEPSGAEYNSITWSSNNNAIATVNGSGRSATVNTVSAGKATITATTDNGTKGNCSVTVYGNNPTSMSISGSSTIDAETSTLLSVSFTPQYQRSSVTWTSSNTNVATVNSSGNVYGNNFGETTITARSANGLTATKKITVQKPRLKIEDTDPTSGESNIPVFYWPKIKFTTEVSEGPGFNNVKLYEVYSIGDDLVDGHAEIQLSTFSWDMSLLCFVPTHALRSYTNYRFEVPKDAVVNKWGGTLESDITITFRTGALNTMALTLQKEGNTIYLNCDNPQADIRYTTDGTQPTMENGMVAHNKEPITIKQNCLFWACAFAEGYYNAEVKQEIFVDAPHMVSVYPAEDQHPSVYRYPFIEFDKEIFFASNGTKPYLTESYLDRDDDQWYSYFSSDCVISGRFLIFIPTYGMDRDNYYKVKVPAGSIVSATGRPNEAIVARLGTPGYTTSLLRIDVMEPVITMHSGQTRILLAKPYPVNASCYFEMESSDPSVATVDWVTQKITARSKGKTIITITGRNNETNIQATCTVYVDMEPDPEYETFPKDGAKDFMVSDFLYIAFNSEKKVSFNDQRNSHVTLLTDDGSTEVKGSSVLVSSAKTDTENQYRLEFRPKNDLEPNTAYVLTVPSELLLKEDGSSPLPDITVHFSTVNLKKMTITPSIKSGTTLYKVSELALTCSEPDAEIRYTLDGKRPTKNSTLYTGPITIDSKTSIWAQAYKDEYIVPRFQGIYYVDLKPFEVVAATYWYPFYDDPYVFKDINPYIEFESEIKDGPLLSECFMINYLSYEEVLGEFITSGNRLVFVPNEPMTAENSGLLYAFYVPDSAVVTTDGRLNAEDFWGVYRATTTAELTGVKIVDDEIRMVIGSKAVALGEPIPVNADYTDWIWTSSDNSVVTVNERGVLTGIAEGEAIVTLTTDNQLSDSCRVIVGMAADISDINIEDKPLNVYDIAGRKIRPDNNSISSLRKGIYLINGKKVMVK